MTVKSAATGIITISALVGNAPYSAPPPVTGYKLWLDASVASSIISTNGAVGQWSDLSGNGYHFYQGTATNQPTTGTRKINNKNVIEFNGSSRMANPTASNFTFMHTSGGASTFVVGFRDTSSSGNVLLDNSGGSSSSIGYYLGTNASDLSGVLVVTGAGGPTAVTQLSGPTVTDNTAFYITALTDPANATAANRSYISVNAGAYTQGNVQTTTPSASAPTYTMMIGDVNTPGSGWDGTIAEILIYPSKLSAGDVTSVKSYLAAKWAI